MLIKCALVFGLLCLYTNGIKSELPEVNGDKFYYFGYGSNLLAKRIHIQNPTAVDMGTGLLKDYRLDFHHHGKRWDGAPATIVPTAGEYVYGRIWVIDLSNLDDIDNQESVPEGKYKPISVPIITSKNETLITRAYVLVDQPEIPLKQLNYVDIPSERQPSKTYLQCLVKGALETGIPNSYVDWLKSIKHNGRVAKDLEQFLELEDVPLDS